MRGVVIPVAAFGGTPALGRRACGPRGAGSTHVAGDGVEMHPAGQVGQPGEDAVLTLG